MAKTKVTLQEAGAIRRFRASADAQQIKEVLLRELHLSREQYENNEANEENRVTVNAVKNVINVLFKDELERLDEQG